MTEEIATRICVVLEKVHAAVLRRPKTLPSVFTRVVAVSKIKPVCDIVAAYRGGQKHFGENYIQELEEKSNNSEILDICKDIKWHFIGQLQRNKAVKLAAIPSLYMVETISSVKVAQALNLACERSQRSDRLNVMIQVNSSQEESKGGCLADDVPVVVSTIIDQCPHLQFSGLMTIGSFHHDLSAGPNPDFQVMLRCRQQLCDELSLDVAAVELSMGMSGDYEHAIEVGSTNVRIGSTIFGERVYPAKS